MGDCHTELLFHQVTAVPPASGFTAISRKRDLYPAARNAAVPGPNGVVGSRSGMSVDRRKTSRRLRSQSRLIN